MEGFTHTAAFDWACLQGKTMQRRMARSSGNRCEKRCRKLLWLSLACSLCTAAVARADGVHVWTSQAGDTLEAKAVRLEEDWVIMERADGQTLEAPLRIFVQEDQKRLKHLFLTAEGGGEFHVPVGQIAGPVSSGDYSYFIYIPKSLRIDREAPLLYFTAAGGGSQGQMHRLVKGAELTGWVVVCSVESRNGRSWDDYYAYRRENLEHIKEHVPIDGDRIYFSGTSGGARVAFRHAERTRGAGVLAIIAGTPGRDRPSTRGHYYFLTGARDYNRYEMAQAYREVHRNSAYRLHPGGHSPGPDWLVTEGIAWLEWQHQRQQRGPARDEYEERLLDWIDELGPPHPYRALYWTRLLLETGVNRSHHSYLNRLRAHLEEYEGNRLYDEGLSDIERMAERIMRDGPRTAPSVFNHTQPDLVREVESLEEKYRASPWISDILKNLKAATVGG